MRISQRAKNILVMGLLMLTLNACMTSGKTSLRTDWIEYPVSMSRSVIHSDGSFITPAAADVVNRFEVTQNNWSIFWGLIPFTKIQGNLSDILKKEIEDHSGDAIIKLKIQTSISEGINPLLIIPIIPSRFQVVLEGDVVTLDNGSKSSVAPSEKL